MPSILLKTYGLPANNEDVFAEMLRYLKVQLTSKINANEASGDRLMEDTARYRTFAPVPSAYPYFLDCPQIVVTFPVDRFTYRIRPLSHTSAAVALWLTAI